MPLFETFSAIMTGAKQAKAITEGIMAVDSKVKDASHNKELAELNNKLAEILNALTESLVDVSRLTFENLELEKRVKLKNLEDFTEVKGYYKKKGIEKFAFCPHCLHKDGTESVLTRLYYEHVRGEHYQCLICKIYCGDGS